jgi:hypothetical protein
MVNWETGLLRLSGRQFGRRHPPDYCFRLGIIEIGAVNALLIARGMLG